MPPTATIHEVVALLRGARFRDNTGLWLLPPDVVGHEPDAAARLGLDPADARRPILDGLDPDSRYLGLNLERTIAALAAIADGPHRADCALVYNLDLLVARLPHQARDALWDTLYRGFPHRRALLLTVPRTAEALLPPDSALDQWRRDGRLAE